MNIVPKANGPSLLWQRMGSYADVMKGLAERPFSAARPCAGPMNQVCEEVKGTAILGTLFAEIAMTMPVGLTAIG